MTDSRVPHDEVFHYWWIPPKIRRQLSRTPDAMMVLLTTTLTGIWMMGSGEAPRSIAEAVPLWTGLAWGLVTTTASFTAFAGLLWRDEQAGWGIEFAGRFTLGIMLLLWALLAAMSSTFPGSVMGLGIIGALGVSCLWRAVVLWRRLRAWRVFLRARINQARHESGSDSP